MIFRGRFRSRILILFVLVLLIFYYLDNLVTLFKDFNSKSSLDQSPSSHKSSHYDKPQGKSVRYPLIRDSRTESTQFMDHPRLRIPTVKLTIPGKAFFKSESWTSVTFKLSFLTLAIYQWQRLGISKYATMKKLWKKYKKSFSHFFIVAYLLSPRLDSQPLPLVDSLGQKIEIKDSDLKNAFPGIFDFTVGILLQRTHIHLVLVP